MIQDHVRIAIWLFKVNGAMLDAEEWRLDELMPGAGLAGSGLIGVKTKVDFRDANGFGGVSKWPSSSSLGAPSSVGALDEIEGAVEISAEHRLQIIFPTISQIYYLFQMYQVEVYQVFEVARPVLRTPLYCDCERPGELETVNDVPLGMGCCCSHSFLVLSNECL